MPWEEEGRRHPVMGRTVFVALLLVAFHHAEPLNAKSWIQLQSFYNDRVRLCCAIVAVFFLWM
jgi:hypothetical protein